MFSGIRFSAEPASSNVMPFDPQSAGLEKQSAIVKQSIFPLRSPLLTERNAQLVQEITTCQSPKYKSVAVDDLNMIIDGIYLGSLAACRYWFTKASDYPQQPYFIISVTDAELLGHPPPNIERLTIDISDDEKGWSSENGMKHQLKKAFSMIDKARIEKIQLLTHCTAGKSRSCILLAAYLMWSTHQPFPKVLSFIRSKRFWVCPSEELKNVLLTDYQYCLQNE